MLTKQQGWAMLGFALIVMLLLFAALYVSRPDSSVCIEHRTASSSKQTVDGVERVNLTEDSERRCSDDEA